MKLSRRAKNKKRATPKSAGERTAGGRLQRLVRCDGAMPPKVLARIDCIQNEGELTISVSCVISVSPPPAQQLEDPEASFLASIGKDRLPRIRDSARRTLTQATASIFGSLVQAWCDGLERTLRNGDKHLTRKR